MRALAGPAMMLVIAGGYLVYHLSSKEDAPSRDFTELEFAGADYQHTGSCYSLRTVLNTNRFFSDATRSWSSPREDAWTLALDLSREPAQRERLRSNLAAATLRAGRPEDTVRLLTDDVSSPNPLPESLLLMAAALRQLGHEPEALALAERYRRAK